jgi:poly-gamma-glutamate synthesis protein (capsule biosynthesis protein)
VVSLHWGSNWGYAIPQEQVDFAHRLVEQGVDVVHGHSSHHVRPIDIYRERLILYGCGDFLNDYEGIERFDKFRKDLTALYFATVDFEAGRLVQLRLVPMQIQRCRLQRASGSDSQWLRDMLHEQSARFGTQIMLDRDIRMTVRPRPA